MLRNKSCSDAGCQVCGWCAEGSPTRCFRVKPRESDQNVHGWVFSSLVFRGLETGVLNQLCSVVSLGGGGVTVGTCQTCGSSSLDVRPAFPGRDLPPSSWRELTDEMFIRPRCLLPAKACSPVCDGILRRRWEDLARSGPAGGAALQLMLSLGRLLTNVLVAVPTRLLCWSQPLSHGPYSLHSHRERILGLSLLATASSPLLL